MTLAKFNVLMSQWTVTSDYFVDALRTTFKGLTTRPDRLPHFHVVTAQDVITPAWPGVSGESGDWMNEIHSGPDACKKLATRI